MSNAENGAEPGFDLCSLFSCRGLLRDGNSDGWPDDIAALIIIGSAGRYRPHGPAAGATRADIGAVDLAARLGLESMGYTPPLAVTDAERPADFPGRVPVIIGPDNRWLSAQPWTHPGPAIDNLRPGEGLVAIASMGTGDPAVIITGRDEAGSLNAARFLAAHWPYLGVPEPGSSDEGSPTITGLRYDLGRFLLDEGYPSTDIAVTWAVVNEDGVIACGIRLAPEPEADACLELARRWRGRRGWRSAYAPYPYLVWPGEGRAIVRPERRRVSHPGLPDEPGSRGGDAVATSTVALDTVSLSSLLEGEVPDIAVDVTEDDSPADVAALAEVACRLGLDATRLRFPIAAPGGRAESLRVRLDHGSPAPDRSELRLCIAPGGGERELAMRLTAESQERHEALDFFIHCPAECDLRQIEDTIADLLRFPGAPGESPAVLLERSWKGVWEVDRFRQMWRNRALPAIPPGSGKIHVDVCVSEPGTIRADIEREVLSDLLKAGFTAESCRVRVYSAFKQGYCWIEEKVLPELKRLQESGGKAISRILIRFAPLGPAAGDPRCLDLSIRWLQELYPADEILARELGLDLSAIDFECVPQDQTYRLEAYSASRDCLYAAEFSSRFAGRPYLDSFPSEGTVHPPTGWLTVTADGVVVLDSRLETDIEAFWRFYQGEFLPALNDLPVPRFEILDVEIALSEDDRPLGIRQERLSPLESLHEDIYFGTLDHFSTLGAKAGAEIVPGAVLPWVHRQEGGAGWAKCTVYGYIHQSPPVEADATVVAVRFPGPVFEVEVRACSPAEAARAGQVLNRWAEHLKEGGEAGSGGGGGSTGVVHVTCRAPEGAAVWQGTFSAAALGLGGIDLPPEGRPVVMDEITGPEELRLALAHLACLPGVAVRRAGRSYRGRPIYAIELSLPAAGTVVSRRKASLYKPTCLINARHHANEVSSTNAVLRLAELCGADPEMMALLKAVNVVLCPLENADGAAIHYRMQQEHPTWKLHAARYNAVGKEFYAEYFNPRTPYGEARVLPGLWRRWRPAVVVDAHGIPAQEWAQPFAGYNSPPRFKVSFWLPNALIYGISVEPPVEGLRLQAEVGTGIRQSVARAIRENADIDHLNSIWLERYEKYGHRWLPDIFPVETTKEVLFYTRPGSPLGNTFAERYPDTTIHSLVMEVADETAQGEYLSLCAKAHLGAMVAVLKYLAGRKSHVVQSRRPVADGTVVVLDRREGEVYGA